MASSHMPDLPGVIYPTKNDRYTVQLGDKLMDASSSAATFSTVKYNYKPHQSSDTRATSIKPNEDGTYILSITNQESPSTEPKTYTYKGFRKGHKKTYVLVFDQANQTCKLEPLDDTYSFNITSNACGTSEDKLRMQHWQFKEQRSDEEAYNTGAAADESDLEPDPDNPYDFRHFLNQVRESASPPHESAAASAMNTPRSDHGRSTPLIQNDIREPPSKARRAQLSSQARKRKMPEPSTSAIKPAKASAVPTVRLDRRASTRPSAPKPPAARTSTKPKSKPHPKSDALVHSSDEEDDPKANTDRFEPDDGGLQIDFGDSGPPRKRHYSTAIPLASATDGPISLRSAANSASNTPLLGTGAGAAGRRLGRKSDDVIEFDHCPSGGGDESDEDDGYREDDEGDERDAEGDDGDIEPMDLGPPAHEARNLSPEMKRVGAGGGAGEEEDEEDAGFEAEMMQELLSQNEEEKVGQVAAAESDEESEEE